MNRNEALARIKNELRKYANDLAKLVLDERKPEDAAHMISLRGEIDGISTIGQAFRVMQREDFHVPGAVELVINALIEDTIEDEFRAVPTRGWTDVA